MKTELSRKNELLEEATKRNEDFRELVSSGERRRRGAGNEEKREGRKTRNILRLLLRARLLKLRGTSHWYYPRSFSKKEEKWLCWKESRGWKGRRQPPTQGQVLSALLSFRSQKGGEGKGSERKAGKTKQGNDSLLCVQDPAAREGAGRGGAENLPGERGRSKEGTPKTSNVSPSFLAFSPV